MKLDGRKNGTQDFQLSIFSEQTVEFHIILLLKTFVTLVSMWMLSVITANNAEFVLFRW